MAGLTIINFFLAWWAHQADSWWLWYLEHNVVVIADIGGEALDILPHCTKSAQKKVIVKAHIHSLPHLFTHSNSNRDISESNHTKTHQTWWKCYSYANCSWSMYSFKGHASVCKQSQLSPESKHKKNAQNMLQSMQRNLRKFLVPYSPLLFCDTL